MMREARERSGGGSGGTNHTVTSFSLFFVPWGICIPFSSLFSLSVYLSSIHYITLNYFIFRRKRKEEKKTCRKVKRKKETPSGPFSSP